MLEKIQKLLTLSKSCNEEEAQLAFQKAKALASKYDIDLELAAIKLGEKAKKEEFAKETVFEGGRLPVVHKHIIYIIQDFFKVKAVYHHGFGTRMVFIGRRNDIAVAKEVYDRLGVTFDFLWKKYKKQKGLPNSSKASYMFGLKVGLTQKLSEEEEETKVRAIEEIPEAMREDCKEKLELALIDEKEELCNALGEFYPKLGRGRGYNMNLNNSNAFEDGKRDGRNINTSRQLSLT